jgi:hypothetical protein
VVSLKRARSLASDLPEATEQDHHGRASFRIGGKIFATVWDESHMNVMLDEPGIRTAAQGNPAACEEFWWGKRLGALSVNLHCASENLLAELLADAWEGKAPKRLTKKPARAVGSGS